MLVLMMDKERILDKRRLKEVKELQKQKDKAKGKGDFIEAAKISNCIGEILSENGCFEDAVEEHKEEIYFSEASNDTIGVAVGHRKVGECFCEMGRFEEALEHQQKHLKIAKSVSNYLEQQRALATIGRTYFVQAERLKEEDGVVKDSLLKSQEAYLKSLDICSKLHNDASEKQILEMKARLYLNLGLIYEYKMNYNEAMRFVSKALIISKEQQLQDNVFRCHLTLFGLYLSNNDLEKALQSSKSALMIAQKENNKTNEMESLSQMGLALLRLGDFAAALNTLKKVYKFTNQTTQVDPIVASNLKLVLKFIKLTTHYDKCDDKKELLSICDKLGDLYSEVGAPEKALKYYLQQLKIADALNLSGKSLAAIYVSIAVTYSECKQFDKALEYHQKELNVKHGDLAEKSSTYCAIATCKENLCSPFDEIKECYMKALECAQGSGNHVYEMRAYRDWLETLRGYGMKEEYENVEQKMKHIMKEYDIADSESQDQEGANCDSPDFSDGELMMLESDDEDIEEKEVSRNSNRKTSTQMKKVNKVNERGETPLHCAAINGNYERAKTLLVQGASVKCRDYCGWTPLHEACNHGHVDIVELLIQYHADVNDPGGQHCGKITPLHDASQNGHINVVKLLIENGACINVKTNDGLTPLELVKNSIKADEEEFSNNSQETSITLKRKEVEKFLLSVLKQQKFKEIPDSSKNRNDKLFGDIGSSSDEDDSGYHLPMKKKKLDLGNWEDMSGNVGRMEPVERTEPPLVDPRNTVEDFSSDCTESLNSPVRKVLVEKQLRDNNSSLYVYDDHTTEIDFRKSSVCTSLVNEEDVLIEDFIVDDMATKRKRQSKIRYAKEVDYIENVDVYKSGTTNKKGKKKKIQPKCLKQKTIEGYADIDLIDDNSNDSNPPPHNEVDMGNQQMNMQNNISTIFRVRIRVNEQTFLISIPIGNQDTIEWLLNETKVRYMEFCGISTKLLLKTRDGALLNPADVITDVIMNNEELVGEVIGLDFPPVIERYRTACNDKKIKPFSVVEEQLLFNLNFSDLHLRDLFLSSSAIDTIFSSISCSMCLTTLDISQIFIGDLNFNPIVNVLHTLPAISAMRFSCIGITTKSLQDLSRLIADGIKDEFKMIMKEPPLFHLLSLHLDHNDFENQSQFIMCMGKIISHCKLLTELNLDSCQLGGGIFDSQSPFRLALKKSRVTSLNLCNNYMGSTEFIGNIFNSVNKECIKSLNLSGTSISKDGFMLKGIWERLESLGNGLKDLNLNSLPVGIDDIVFSNVSLERLSLNYQTGDFDSLAALCKSCLVITNLLHLDLSFSKNLDNDIFVFILQNLKTNSTMKTIILQNCAITSPLQENIFHRLCELNYSGLSCLDLSYNDIKPQDKSKLLDAWNIVHHNNALHEFHHWKCLLFIR